LIAVPEFERVQFLNAPVSSFSLQLLNDLKLATCLRTPEVVEKYIISNWSMIKSSYYCKEQMARLVFSQYSGLSSISQIKLQALPVVPVARFDGRVTSNFLIAKDLIDRSTSLNELFFDDEEVIPENSFSSQFHMCLKDIGLKTTVDQSLASSRIHNYADSSHLLSEIETRVQALLRLPCPWRSSPNSSHDLELRRLKWLPVTDSQGALQLKSPAQCRPLRKLLLVGSQFSMFDFPISIEWEALLGWLDVLPKHVLLGQLRHGLQTQDRAVVDAVLTYILQKDQTALLLKDLQGLPCVLTSKDLYVTRSKAFRPPAKLALGCEGLYPYLGDIDKKFWQDHHILLELMGTREKVSLDDLLAVQTVLEAQLPLSEQDITVAVEILRLAGGFQGTSLSGLKVLSIDGYFYPLHEVSYNDLGVLKPENEAKLTHPEIPLRYVKRLGIESLSARLIKGMLQIADIDDEDEFEQHEKITTRIADTLDRYSIDSTFREYLANADDTVGTSRISWLLDERTHTKERLVTPELEAFQGTALLVHNDGGKSHPDFSNTGVVSNIRVLIAQILRAVIESES
jgi:sacsin